MCLEKTLCLQTTATTVPVPALDTGGMHKQYIWTVKPQLLWKGWKSSLQFSCRRSKSLCLYTDPKELITTTPKGRPSLNLLGLRIGDRYSQSTCRCQQYMSVRDNYRFFVYMGKTLWLQLKTTANTVPVTHLTTGGITQAVYLNSKTTNVLWQGPDDRTL